MQQLLIIVFFISLQGLMPVHRPVEPLTVQDGSNVEKADVFDSLVWSDEFDGSGTIDTSKWFQQTKLPPGGSWWGGLIQHYTDKKENAYIKDGFMNLVAKKNIHDSGRNKTIHIRTTQFQVCIHLWKGRSKSPVVGGKRYLAGYLDA